MERAGEGVNGSFLIVQLNCQGARQVMHDLGSLVYEDGVDVLLLQEPWRYEERVCGLPGSMRVFESVSGKAAVVIVNEDWDVMLVSRSGLEGRCQWSFSREKAPHLAATLQELAAEHGYGEYVEKTIDEKVDVLNEWVTSACDEHLEKKRRLKGRLKWWTRELETKKREVQGSDRKPLLSDGQTLITKTPAQTRNEITPTDSRSPLPLTTSSRPVSEVTAATSDPRSLIIVPQRSPSNHHYLTRLFS
ncbi:unnamed protein product [Trichogramma brassicae]|uniref:Endonuclease/exonuclease/phosphatase domain-containing protein n=1 Tax=Trichogramma brassicae TaxID=86971 RepID=A0A6H5I7S5_9HYME|nr:unnamed protein product [Trichogramma brassicae]